MYMRETSKINGKEMYRLFLEKAEQGDALAQYRLANMYEVGYGVKKDKNKAFEWYQKAAEQHNVDACYKMGEIYLHASAHDDVVKPDNKKAFDWYLQAAEHGHHEAQHVLGLWFLYELEKYGEEYVENAFKYFAEVAKQENKYSDDMIDQVNHFFGLALNEEYAHLYDQCLKFSKNRCIVAQYMLGQIYCQKGIKENNRKYLKKALEFFTFVLETALVDYYGGSRYRKNLHGAEFTKHVFYCGEYESIRSCLMGIEIMWNNNKLDEQDKAKVLGLLEMAANAGVPEIIEFLEKIAKKG